MRFASRVRLRLITREVTSHAFFFSARSTCMNNETIPVAQIGVLHVYVPLECFISQHMQPSGRPLLCTVAKDDSGKWYREECRRVEICGCK